MRPPTQQNSQSASHHQPAAPLPPPHDEGRGANICGTDNSADATVSQTGRSPVVTDDELARSLAEVNELPRRFSWSRLVPYTKHLLKLEQGGYSYRYMAKWLFDSHKVVVVHTTVSRFMKRVEQEERRAKRASAAKKARVLAEQLPTGSIPTTPPAYVPPVSKQTEVSRAAEAIRAVKAKAKEAKPPEHAPLSRFDPNEPLLRSKPKPNRN